MRLLDLHYFVRLVFNLDSFGVDYQFTPLIVNEVLSFVFIEFLLPEVRSVDLRGSKTPCDMISASSTNCRYSR